MRFLLVLMVIAAAAVVFAAVVLRMESARSLLRTLRNAAWIYIAVMFTLAAIEAYRRWA